MKHVLRASAIGTVLALVALALVPVAGANKPAREIIPAPDDMVIEGQCAFPVVGHIDGYEIDTTFFDNAGNPFRLRGAFPANRSTFTNLDTGKSITVGSTGSFHRTFAPDGTSFAMVTGEGAWLGNPVTGEPGIWFQRGRVSATLDADGNPTSVNATGTLVNLCSELA